MARCLVSAAIILIIIEVSYIKFSYPSTEIVIGSGQQIITIENFMKITVNIILHLELIIILPIFPPFSHPTVVCFFLVGLSVLIQHFQQGL